jgi:prepilin-type N-terminal cleavage/methylation domain-containing protein
MNDKRMNRGGRSALWRGGRRSHGKGFTLIEVLAASVIVGTCLAAVVSMWAVAFTLSTNADHKSVGYNLGRRALEEAKQTGFQDTAEGTTTNYYDATGGSRSATRTSAHSYSVAVTVSTDSISGGVPAPAALRTVSITVRFLRPDTTVYQCSTYLARAGI